MIKNIKDLVDGKIITDLQEELDNLYNRGFKDWEDLSEYDKQRVFGIAKGLSERIKLINNLLEM